MRKTSRPSTVSRSAAILAPWLIVSLNLLGCAPSINQAAKADIDRRLASLPPPSAHTRAPKAGEYAPMPLAPGQWTQYKILDSKSQPSLYTQKILEEVDGAYWVETVMDTYQGRTIQKMLVWFGDRTDPSQLQIRAAKTKDVKGRVNELPPELMPMMQSLYKGMVSNLAVQWKGVAQEEAVAPAGKFDGCYRMRSKGQWGPWHSEADSWSHPAVPIAGTVRSRGIDNKFEMELVAYGLTGAESEF